MHTFLTAKSFPFPADPCPRTAASLLEEYESLAASFESGLAPSGPVEAELVQQLIAATWNARRCSELERLETNPRVVVELGRHRERIERNFHRASRAFAKLRGRRGASTLTSSRMAEDLCRALAAARKQADTHTTAGG